MTTELRDYLQVALGDGVARGRQAAARRRSAAQRRRGRRVIRVNSVLGWMSGLVTTDLHR